jgi:predicted DsbA family dithiol-disulfide isomerase
LAPAVRFTLWSDFLCPWCYVAALRLHALRAEAGALLELEWRPFLLRPRAQPRDLAQFTAYTERWARPAAAEPSAGFRVWSGGQPPPSHSLPSAVAGKAVQQLFTADEFERFHLALMRAYFAENRTISDRRVILAVARAAGLDAGALAERLEAHGGPLEEAVVADHKAALAAGIAAVPTVVAGGEHVLRGAMTLEQYRKVLARLAS